MKDNEILDLFQEQGLKLAKTSEQLEELTAKVAKLEKQAITHEADVVDIYKQLKSEVSENPDDTYILRLTAAELQALWTGHESAWRTNYQYFEIHKETKYKNVDHEQLFKKMKEAIAEVQEERHRVVIIIEPAQEGVQHE